MTSPLGGSADQRRLIIRSRLEDDPTIDWQDGIAYFFNEAIGKITAKGDWNKAWKAYGLYSKLNGIATIEIKSWDHDNIEGKLTHIYEHEFQALCKIKADWLAQIRADLENRKLREDAKADLDARIETLKRLNEERKREEQIEAIATALKMLQERDRQYASTLTSLSPALLAARITPIRNQRFQLEEADKAYTASLSQLRLKLTQILDARIQAKAQPIRTQLFQLAQRDRNDSMALLKQQYQLKAAETFFKDAYLDRIIADNLPEIHKRAALLSYMQRGDQKLLDQIHPTKSLPTQLLDPWMIITSDSYSFQLQTYAERLNQIFNSNLGTWLLELSEKLPPIYCRDGTFRKEYRSRAAFMATAANDLLNTAE